MPQGTQGAYVCQIYNIVIEKNPVELGFNCKGTENRLRFYCFCVNLCRLMIVGVTSPKCITFDSCMFQATLVHLRLAVELNSVMFQIWTITLRMGKERLVVVSLSIFVFSFSIKHVRENMLS